MTAPHIIDPAGLLGQALGDASPDLMRHLLSTVIKSLLSARQTRSAAPITARVARNGSTPASHQRRELDTRICILDVAVPKLRSGSYFPEWLLERRKRAEAALVSVVATCYLLGISIRRMDRLVPVTGDHQPVGVAVVADGR